MLAGFLVEHRATLEVLTQTVYPGTRRFAGEAQNLIQLFGAPHLWVLQKSPALAGSNQSEMSSAYLALGVAAAVLVPSIRWRRLGSLGVPAVTSGVVLAVLALWCTITWPLSASQIPLVSLLSPGRLVQVLGLLATTTFGLVLAAWVASEGVGRRKAAIVAGLLVFYLTAMAGSGLRSSYVPSLQIRWVWLMSVVFAIAVAVAVAHARRAWSLVPLVAVAVGVVVFVNPWQQGSGSLQRGAAAQQVNRLEPVDGVWAADSLWIDALLMANAKRALSGQQWSGPNRAAWGVLDPSGAAESAWNRAAAYLTFRWAAPGRGVTIAATAPDVITITADPCDGRLKTLQLKRIVSGRELTHSCLTAVGSFPFGGATHWVYNLKS